jgi:hypothetical protein
LKVQTGKGKIPFSAVSREKYDSKDKYHFAKLQGKSLTVHSVEKKESVNIPLYSHI